MALDRASDLLKLQPIGEPDEVQRYLAEFRCRGLVKAADGRVTEANRFLVGLFFPDDYLRRADVPTVLTWLEPFNVLHPNIRPPFICVGRLVPGTGLVDLLYQIFEIITWHKFNPREDDSLNHQACSWARNNQHRFPTDSRPLKRLSRMAASGSASVKQPVAP